MEGPDFATLSFGFALGLRHATDADHVAAVGTLLANSATAHTTSSAQIRNGAMLGAWWGAGHLITVLISGGFLIGLQRRLLPMWEWFFELAVAAVLIFLGARTIQKCFRGRFHFHRHEHPGVAHTHLHFHEAQQIDHQHHAHIQAQSPRPLLLGMLHGLAGTAALALLVLSSSPSRGLAIVFLLFFGLGALAGMTLFGAAASLPLLRAGRKPLWLNAARLAAGTASFLLGVVLISRTIQL
jgi:hypothetical protein